MTCVLYDVSQGMNTIYANLIQFSYSLIQEGMGYTVCHGVYSIISCLLNISFNIEYRVAEIHLIFHSPQDPLKPNEEHLHLAHV